MVNSYCDVYNNIVTDNTSTGIEVIYGADLDGNGVASEFFNNDLWNNDNDYVGTPDQTGINGNISKDPEFKSENDFRLMSSSPCIDTGNDGWADIINHDIAGTFRPIGQGVDIGCYEMSEDLWVPRWIQPLALFSTATANDIWSSILQNLPSEMTSQLSALIEEVGVYMEQAGSLSNPIYTNGVLQKAISIMEEINSMI